MNGKIDKNIQNYQILTKFEYLIFWISKNLDRKFDKNLSKRNGRSYNLRGEQGQGLPRARFCKEAESGHFLIQEMIKEKVIASKF